MIRFHKNILCKAAIGLAAMLYAMPTMAQGTLKNINEGWRFHAGDVQNAAAVSTDDSQWRSIRLPHDFQIEQPWVEPDPSSAPTTPTWLPISRAGCRAVVSKRWARDGTATT